MNVSLNIPVTPSARRSRREQKERERLEQLGERRIEGIKNDLMQLARDTYIRHIKQCQGNREIEKRWIIRDIDIRIWFHHYAKPRPKAKEGKASEPQRKPMETQVRVYSREIGETLVITYSHFAAMEPKSSGWLLGCRLT
jgi:hypothetical protein